MQEAKKDLLFAELTPEESASVNGGYYYNRGRHHRDYYRYDNRNYNSPYYDGRQTHGYIPSSNSGC
jgi:hypothetical protein